MPAVPRHLPVAGLTAASPRIGPAAHADARNDDRYVPGETINQLCRCQQTATIELSQ